MAIKGYWRFNGNSNDYSGGGNNGTDYLAAYGNAYGKINQGLYLAGNAGYVDTPSQNFNYITVSVWVKMMNTVGQAHLFVSKDGYLRGGDGLRGYNLFYDQSESNWKWEVFTTSSSNTLVVSDVSAVGKWKHLVAIFNGTQQLIFVDGVQKGVASLTGTLRTNTSGIRFGTRNSTTGYSLNGYLDEAKVDDGIWSPAKVKNETSRILGFF